jgi:hypothetical protein
MGDAFGWIYVAIVLVASPAAGIIAMALSFSKKPVEEKYRGTGGGLSGAFDAVWSPSAHEASMERDRETRRAIPAPTPDPDWAIRSDTGGKPGKIRIDVGEVRVR